MEFDSKTAEKDKSLKREHLLPPRHHVNKYLFPLIRLHPFCYYIEDTYIVDLLLNYFQN